MNDRVYESGWRRRRYRVGSCTPVFWAHMLVVWPRPFEFYEDEMNEIQACADRNDVPLLSWCVRQYRACSSSSYALSGRFRLGVASRLCGYELLWRIKEPRTLSGASGPGRNQPVLPPSLVAQSHALIVSYDSRICAQPETGCEGGVLDEEGVCVAVCALGAVSSTVLARGPRAIGILK